MTKQHFNTLFFSNPGDSLRYAPINAAPVCLAICEAYKNKQKLKRIYSNIPNHINNICAEYLHYIITSNCVWYAHFYWPFMFTTPRTKPSKKGFHLSICVYSNLFLCLMCLFFWPYMFSTPIPKPSNSGFNLSLYFSILRLHNGLLRCLMCPFPPLHQEPSRQ